MQDSNPEKSGLSWSTPAAASAPKTPATPAQPAAAKPAPHKMEMPSQKALPMVVDTNAWARYVGFLVGGVIVGVLLAWGYTAMQNGGAAGIASTSTPSTNTKATTTASGTTTTGTTQAAAGSDAGLTVSSPQSAGTSVAIAKAVVSEPTWIVVYEDNAGKPGTALGAALFFPQTQSGSVPLLRTTVSGRSYLITKQVDNGDRKFSLKQDPILTPNGGQAQWVELQVK